MQFSTTCKGEQPFAPPKCGVFFELVQTPVNPEEEPPYQNPFFTENVSASKRLLPERSRS